MALPATLVVKAGEQGSVQVTFTLPAGTEQRAVVTMFRAGLVPPGGGAIGLGASLGTLITFSVSSDYKMEIGPVQASLQTAEANVVLSQALRNNGTEPVVPKGCLLYTSSLDHPGQWGGRRQ